MTRTRDFAALVWIVCIGVPAGVGSIIAIAYEIGLVVGKLTS